MYDLNETYIEQLEIVAGEIQESELLQQYLEEEEEDLFIQLKEEYEPRIAAIYEEVGAQHPLQLIAVELVLLDPAFEGLFLPKILGYTVLRGEIDKNYKYVRPQEHFKEVLMAICQSTNFDILKKRIGQSIQMGFALSSDIWVTNLINAVDNKRIRHYLQSQKQERYRRDNERAVGYERYARQFKNETFHTAEFPDTVSNLKVLYNSLRDFLFYRINQKLNNDSLLEPMDALVANTLLHNEDEHLYLMTIYGSFFDLPETSRAALSSTFAQVRANIFEADEKILSFLMGLGSKEIDLTPEADRRLSALVDKTKNDQLAEYYNLIDVIHDKGYINAEVHEAIQQVYVRHEGLSMFNEGIRRTIYRYFARFIQNLDEREYPEFFEISKAFTLYMNLFGNQHFNQDIEDLSMAYISKLMTRYTDKRGKDYQDIKKFVSTVFLDLNFLEDKEVVELFKTRRKRKTDE